MQYAAACMTSMAWFLSLNVALLLQAFVIDDTGRCYACQDLDHLEGGRRELRRSPHMWNLICCKGQVEEHDGERKKIVVEEQGILTQSCRSHAVKIAHHMERPGHQTATRRHDRHIIWGVSGGAYTIGDRYPSSILGCPH